MSEKIRERLAKVKARKEQLKQQEASKNGGDGSPSESRGRRKLSVDTGTLTSKERLQALRDKKKKLLQSPGTRKSRFGFTQSNSEELI